MFRRLYCLLLVLLVGLLTSSVSAKGIPEYYTVEGPGIETPVRFQIGMDTALIFDPTTLFDTPPEVSGEPFIVRSYILGEEFMLSPLHYYPQTDGSAYIFFVGAQDRGVGQEFDNHWYEITPEAEAFIERAIYNAQYRTFRFEVE